MESFYQYIGQADSSSCPGEVKSSVRKGMGIQDSEVSPLEYVQSKIAQCRHDDSSDGKLGQSSQQSTTDMHQAMSTRGPHSQVSLNFYLVLDLDCDAV
jgi:hypothetical protein